MNRALKILDAFADMVGRIVSPLTIVMMLLTCIVVIARYILNVGAIQIQESVIYLHGIVVMLGIAYTLRHEGHVRVDIFYQKFSPRLKAMVNLFGTLVFLFPVAIFILWSSIDYVHFSWQLKEVSAEPGGLPFVYVQKSLLLIMAALLILQGVAEILRNIVQITNREDQHIG